MKCCLYRFSLDVLQGHRGLHCKSKQDLYSMMTQPYMLHHSHRVQFAAALRKGNQMARLHLPLDMSNLYLFSLR